MKQPLTWLLVGVLFVMCLGFAVRSTPILLAGNDKDTILVKSDGTTYRLDYNVMNDTYSWEKIASVP